MPIYEYACKSCDHRLDALQKISDEPLRECPECGQPELKRLLSAPRFRLKGEGWYETDFKKDNQRNLSTADDAPARKEGKSGEDKSKSDSKSEKSGSTDKKTEKKASSNSTS